MKVFEKNFIDQIYKLKNLPDSFLSKISYLNRYRFYNSLIDRIYSFFDITSFNFIVNKLKIYIDQVDTNQQLKSSFEIVFAKHQISRLDNWYIACLRELQKDLSRNPFYKEEEVKAIDQEINYIKSLNKVKANHYLIIKLSTLLSKNLLKENTEERKYIDNKISELEDHLNYSLLGKGFLKILGKKLAEIQNRAANYMYKSQFLSNSLYFSSNLFKIVTSNVFVNIVWIISAVIAFTATTVTGILPFVSIIGTCAIIIGSIVAEVNIMRNYRNLVEEETYLKEINKIQNSKYRLLEENSLKGVLKTSDNLNKELQSNSKDSKFSEPDLKWSLFKVIRDKIPSTTVTLIVNIISFNPVSMIIAAFNSVLSHTMSTLSRKENDEKKFLIKEEIMRHRKDENCPNYKNLKELKEKYLLAKAELKTLEENARQLSKQMKENKKDNIQNIFDIEKQKHLNKRPVSLLKRLLSPIGNAIADTAKILNPFYSKSEIDSEIAKRFTSEVKIAQPAKIETKKEIFPIIIEGIRNTLSAFCAIFGMKYLFGETGLHNHVLATETNLAMATAASQIAVSSIKQHKATEKQHSLTDSANNHNMTEDKAIPATRLENILEQMDLKTLSLLSAEKDSSVTNNNRELQGLKSNSLRKNK